MSIGNFDGLHRGHARILQTMHTLRNRQSDARGAPLVVVTFEPHPLAVLRPQLAPPRLTPPDMKQRLLQAAGVEELVVLPPTPAVLGLTAEQFWAILRDQVRPSHLVEGASFNFGKDRQGTIDRLRQWSAGSNVHLHVIDAVQVPLLDLHIVQVSSSLIRWLISYGRVRDAAICLGRAYTLAGKVVRGHGRGRQIGIPTANLDCGDQLLPADGVYAARCTLQGTSYPVALSIGTMPTFGHNPRQVEAHILDFAADLYDRFIEVEVIDWIRDQLPFPTVRQLKDQLLCDFQQVRDRLTLDPTRACANTIPAMSEAP
jgi:riboflavin kinase/FMN adenylyltransferase